jgi:hypothetical protein
MNIEELQEVVANPKTSLEQYLALQLIDLLKQGSVRKNYLAGYDEGHSRGVNCGRLYKVDDGMRGHRHACANAYSTSPEVSWIPCRVRNPEESGRYLCYVEEINSLGKSHYQWNCSWNGQVWSDAALTGRVTHWRELPERPEIK